MGNIKITETVLRDGHQSLIATRMTTEEMLPILEVMDTIGYNAVEMWGGATYDACIRFLNEDPWDRLKAIRMRMPNTKLQMLLRGQNLLGYKNYADDVVDEFINHSAAEGIDIIRMFDALNDKRNLEQSVKACNKYGVHAQAAISYTVSPAHTNKTFIDLAAELEQMGVQSICIKDMAGLLDPYNTYNLVKGIKAKISVPLEIHTHATSGLGAMTYMKAAEAGADIIDTASSPFAGGTSQPATEPMVAAFRGTEHDTGLDMDALTQVAEYFRPIREKYLAEGVMSPKVLGVDINTLKYQVPGGMISNLISQLHAQGTDDKLEGVLKEVPEVRKDFGYPPLVTPTSQIVGTQAALNVITGERYKMIPTEAKQLLKGMYGKTTVPVNKDLADKVVHDDKMVTCRPADLIKPELSEVKEKFKKYLRSVEDLLTCALFPQNAKSFLIEKYHIKDVD